MKKDTSYKILKRSLESGNIEDLNEIVDIIGKTNFTNAVGIHYDTFRKRINKPEDFTIKHIRLIADLLQVDPRLISNLIFDSMEKKRKKGKS